VQVEIGRAPTCDVSLPDVLGLSRFHGSLRYGDGGVTYEDLGSTNGSFVNDRRVVGPVKLESGDRLQLGPLHFKLLLEEDVESAYFDLLHQLATRDGLTEILNKRRFDEELARELARALRHRRPLSLILFDVDHFKKVNDLYGHLCGDFILQGLAKLVRRFIRPEQVLARVGGEEFAVLCPETGPRGATTLAEKLRRAIAEFRFDPEPAPAPIAVTCSFGVACVDESTAEPADLYGTADRALYRSKDAGRNRVSFESA
jgi:diguanylate cyclase (GGDEF)-like protein